MEKIINRGLELLTKYETELTQFDITSPIRQAYFLATLATECEFHPRPENLNYSEQRLFEVFRKYFPTLESTKGYAHNTIKIGNRVYANRMGNGNEASGDGYKYRGRGYIQLTGKSNYQALSNYTKIDFVTNPDFLLQEQFAFLSACWFFKGHKCLDWSDLDNAVMVRKRVNGGVHGLKEFVEYLDAFKKELNVT